MPPGVFEVEERWRKAAPVLRECVVTAGERGVAACIRVVPDPRVTTPGAWEAAASAARSAAKQVLFSADVFDRLVGRQLEAPKRAALEMSFDALATPLRLAPSVQLVPLPRIGACVAVLAVGLLGMLAGGRMSSLIAVDRGTCNLIGGSLGVVIVVALLADHHRLPWVRAALAWLTPRELRSATGSWSASEISQVRVSIEQWAASAALLIVAFSGEEGGRQSGDETAALRATLAALGARLAALHSAKAADLPVAVDELLVEARRLGFEGIDGPAQHSAARAESARQSLRWDEALAERYSAFGYVEPGDAVFVEREPVVHQGRVLEKGVVRKQRGASRESA